MGASRTGWPARSRSGGTGREGEEEHEEDEEEDLGDAKSWESRSVRLGQALSDPRIFKSTGGRPPAAQDINHRPTRIRREIQGAGRTTINSHDIPSNPKVFEPKNCASCTGNHGGTETQRTLQSANTGACLL